METDPVAVWSIRGVVLCFFLLCVFWPLFYLFKESPSWTHPPRWGRLIGSGLLALCILPFTILFWAEIAPTNPPLGENARIPLGLAWSPSVFLLVISYFFHNLALLYATQPRPYRDHKYERSEVTRWSMRYVAMFAVTGAGFLVLFLGAWLASF